MEIFFKENSRNPELEKQLLELDPQFYGRKSMKTVSQTRMYKQFVKEKIETGQRASSLVGNMYTGSIFHSLMSMLESELNEDASPEKITIGFCSYGSGSKSKVFEGELQPNWKTVVGGFRLFQTLAKRVPIDFETYEILHTGSLKSSVIKPKDEFFLKEISTSADLYGKRVYEYAEKIKVEHPLYTI